MITNWIQKIDKKINTLREKPKKGSKHQRQVDMTLEGK